MTDGISTAAVPLATGTAGIGLASLVGGLDLSAVIGAFGGAFFFVMWAKDISGWQRAGYLVTGWIGGYLFGLELLARNWGLTPGASSFFAGLVCIVVCISVIEAVQTGKWPAWMQAIWGRLGGNKGSTE